MDNAEYNFKIIINLFEVKKNQVTEIYNKPITILIISTIECILYDLVSRIKEHRHENMPQLSKKSIIVSRNKKLDEFGKVINHVKKYSYLGDDSNIYTALDSLRIIRNMKWLH